MMLPLSENAIFWNVYEQECRFRGIDKTPPRYVRATCNKLAALYPDLDDAEMFMRAQFVTYIGGIDYGFLDLVFAFKDFIKDRHHQAYNEYKRTQARTVANRLAMADREIKEIKSKSSEDTLNRLLEEANVTLSDFQSRGLDALEHLPEERQWDICESLPLRPEHSSNPLVRYLLEKEDCPQEYQEVMAIHCLHYPLLMNEIPLTEGLKERVRFYKDEVRGTKSPSRSPRNSKYLLDLSDL